MPEQVGGAVTADPHRKDGTSTMDLSGLPHLLMPHEVARLFRVDSKTVNRWCGLGRIDSIRTPAGHRRFQTATVAELLAENGVSRDDIPELLHRIVRKKKAGPAGVGS